MSNASAPGASAPGASTSQGNAAASPVCFGKMPTYGDFIHMNASGGTARALERWFQEGLYNLQARLRQHSLNGAYDHAPTLRYIFCPTASSTLLLGALCMSRDESGRRYPFTVASEVDRNHLPLRHISLLPLFEATFLKEASGLVKEAARGALLRETLPERLGALASSACGDISRGDMAAMASAEETLERYFQDTTFRAFAERIWGDFEDSRKYLVLRNLLVALKPVRRAVPARFSLGLRFPLGGRETAAQDASFWIKLSLRVLEATNATPTFFWNDAVDGAKNAGTLLLFFRPPPPRAFTQLLPVRLQSDNICELERAGREDAARVVLSLPDRYGRLLESETVTLQAFLDHF